jgi:hypothetical protein
MTVDESIPNHAELKMNVERDNLLESDATPMRNMLSSSIGPEPLTNEEPYVNQGNVTEEQHSKEEQENTYEEEEEGEEEFESSDEYVPSEEEEEEEEEEEYIDEEEDSDYEEKPKRRKRTSKHIQQGTQKARVSRMPSKGGGIARFVWKPDELTMLIPTRRSSAMADYRKIDPLVNNTNVSMKDTFIRENWSTADQSINAAMSSRFRWGNGENLQSAWNFRTKSLKEGMDEDLYSVSDSDEAEMAQEKLKAHRL